LFYYYPQDLLLIMIIIKI